MKWTSDLAYAVGLITTDGCLSPDERHISVTSTDIQLLQAFKNSLNKSNKIGKNTPSKIGKKPAFRVQIGDVKLYRFLQKIGLTRNKSLTLNQLKINSKYFPDFLRGHLDGDGSIIYYKDYYNTLKNSAYIYDRLFVYFLSSSKNHIIWLQKTILELTGLKGSISRNRPKSQIGSSMSIRLKYSTKEAKLLLNLIYYEPNLPCLERKRLIAKPFLKYS